MTPPPVAPETALPQDAPALIDHVLARYHAVHRQQMPELIRLAQRVEAAHPGHPDLPRGLADLLARMAWEMEAHMQKEEQGLFPALRDGSASMAMAMALMRDEHDDHHRHLETLEALTRGHRPPADACGSWRALCAGTATFAADLREHIRIENDILFPACGG
jgi:regulator of cell morphogenesis and NO signaling